MKIFFALAFLLISFAAASAQHEYAPLKEQEIAYKDWNYKSVRDGKKQNLRELSAGKKLVMVVYFSAWCPNWKLAAPVAQRLYDKYRADGLAVVGVGEYETAEATRRNLDELKITFPVVYESEKTDARQKTEHYAYRQQTGDTRKWGSPWNIFVEPAQFAPKGDELVSRAFVVNGELIEAEAETFIRQKLGLSAQ